MQVFLNRIIVLTAVIILLIVISCGERSPFGGEDDKLIIDNNTQLRLYIYPQINHPDTSISSYNPSYSKNYEVLPNSEKRITSRSWDQTVTSSVSDTLMVFFYNADLVDATDWDVVVSDYLILKRYDLSLEDLQGMNWTITYP